jgi:histone-lysine N-methyltransferase SETMAR
VGGKIIAVTKKSRAESIKCEGVVGRFFYWKGFIHHELVPHDRTVNGQFYLEVIKHLREAVQRKRPEGWGNKTWMLHHDKAPAHMSLVIRKFLAKHDMTHIPQPPYSPDLAPVDFLFVPELKSTLKGRRFQTIEEIEEISLWDLRAIKLINKCFKKKLRFFSADHIGICNHGKQHTVSTTST